MRDGIQGAHTLVREDEVLLYDDSLPGEPLFKRGWREAFLAIAANPGPAMEALAVHAKTADLSAVDRLANLVEQLVTSKAMSVPGEIAITSMPQRVHELVRDKAGKPIGSVENDA